MYTFGQPRTGNPAYADLAEQLIGADNIYRGEYPSESRNAAASEWTADSVTSVLPSILSYGDIWYGYTYAVPLTELLIN